MGEAHASDTSTVTSSTVEKYTLNGSDNVIKFIRGQNVVLSVEPEPESRDRDSARVQTKTISDYKSDRVRSLNGRFLAVRGELIAFRFHIENSGEVVRVINRVSRSRHLVKGFHSNPVDLLFAPNADLLAIIDEDCGLYTYSVAEDCQDISRYLNVVNWKTNGSDRKPRITWCAYVPENQNDPDDICHMIAVYKDKEVTVLNLSMLKESFGTGQTDLASARSIPGAVLTVTMEEIVTTMCISPDSTAVAIGTTDGVVSFYVVNGNELRFAHNWNPQLNGSISDLFFLDSSKSLKNQEQFWRHCLAVGEGGRRMALFECENWRCLGRLRFESSLELQQFNVFVDPLSRFVHILDTNGSNVFCIELDEEIPRFSSITHIIFCHPIVSIVPYDVVDECEEDMEAEDEADSKRNVAAHYVAIGHKSLVQLEIQLEKTEPIRIEEMDEQHDETEEFHSDQEDHDVGTKQAVVTESLTPVQLEQPSLLAEEPYALSKTPNVSGVGREFFEDKINELTQLVEQLSVKVERSEEERKAAATNEHIMSLLHAFKEEFSLREDRLLANISDLIEANRTETVNVVRNALNENSVAVESLMQSNQKISADLISQKVGDRTREALAGVVVPALDTICQSLFKQLNDAFRNGLDQYMHQLRALQTATLAAVAASATPAPMPVMIVDRNLINNFLKNNQWLSAFEAVLNQGDQVGLDYICKQLDPDHLFSIANLIPQNVLLSLLQQISLKLDPDTDLKFRYMEHIIERLELGHSDIEDMLPRVLEAITKALYDFQARTENSSLRRQARVINHLIRTALNTIRRAT